MLYYVNDHLIQDEVASEGTWTNTKDNTEEAYKRILITTAANAVKREEDGSFVPTSRTICAHMCSLDPKAKTRIANIIPTDSTITRVSIRTSIKNKYDNDAFVVAIPYDGMIIPMDQKDALSIYRFMILKSDKVSIEHEDRKYRRCIYFVVSPREQAGADEWYPDDCNLVVKTVRSNLARGAEPDENTVWTITTHTVRFGLNGTFEITHTTEDVPFDTIDASQLRDAELCHVMPPVNFTGNRTSGTGRPSTGEGRPTKQYHSGNTMAGAMKKAMDTRKDDSDEPQAKKGGKKRRRRK